MISNSIEPIKKVISDILSEQLNQEDNTITDLKQDVELSTLISSLRYHKVATQIALLNMSTDKIIKTAANYLSDRQFYQDIQYHKLDIKDLNYIFKTSEDINYICYLYSQVEQYQPLYKVLDNRPECVDGLQRSESTLERAEVILGKIQDFLDPEAYKSLNILDIGSSLGYISNYVAYNSMHNVSGIDFDTKNNWISNLVSLNLKTGARFSTEKLTKGYADSLSPEYDVIFCLSVLHHVNNEHGTDYVKDVISSIVNKSPFIFFELAHKGENVKFSWRDALPYNILDYFGNLQEYDYKLHFLGEFDTHLSEISRPLYLLERKYITVNGKKYYYDKVEFEAHTMVHTEKYSTTHRYYKTQDDKYFIKEYVELGNTEDLKHIADMYVKYLYNSKEHVYGVDTLVDYELSTANNNHLITVFHNIKGALLCDILHSITTHQAFSIAQSVINTIVNLDKIGLNHGDIKIWNIMHNSDNGETSLIDFDHAYEINNTNEVISREQNRDSILWILKSISDKDFSKEEMNKVPSMKHEEYGVFDCLAKDVIENTENIDMVLNNMYYFDDTNTATGIDNLSGCMSNSINNSDIIQSDNTEL